MSTQACGAAEVKSFLANAPDGFPGTFSHLLKGHRKAIDKIIMGAVVIVARTDRGPRAGFWGRKHLSSGKI